jgi:hypothetical protein
MNYIRLLKAIGIVVGEIIIVVIGIMLGFFIVFKTHNYAGPILMTFGVACVVFIFSVFVGQVYEKLKRKEELKNEINIHN